MRPTRTISRHMLARLLATVLLVAVIAACGGAPEAQNPTAAAPAATAAPAAPAPTTAPAATAAPEPTTAPAATAAPEPTTAPAPTAVSEATAAPAAAVVVPNPPPEAGTPGGTMTGAWVGPCCVGVDNLNPLSAGGDYHFLDKIYSHLVTYDVTYSEIVSDLAEKWSVSDDNLTWTFKLHPGVKWHDGSAFTADDVAFSLELCIDPKAGGCDRGAQLGAIKGVKDYIDGKATSIAGIEVADPTTIKITTDKPYAPLLDVLTETWILQKASVGQIARDKIKGNDYWFNTAIGTGPFKLVKHEKGQSTELARFDDYFRGKPLLDKLIRREFKDVATALLAFDKGEIDFTYLTADEVEREQQNANATIIPGPSGVNNMLVFNSVKYPQFNVKFRQAILYAINRQSIIENLYKGAATPVSCLYNNPAYVPSDVEKFEYNPEKAKALLAESGVDLAALGDLEMSTYYGDQLSLDVMTAIQQDLAAVGIKVTPRAMDSAAWIKLFYEDVTFPVSFIGGANGADPNRAYEYFYSTAAWPQGQNNLKYNNPEFDKLLTQGAEEMDPAKRGPIYQQACRILAQDQPWIQLWETVRYGIVSKRIGNFLFKPAPSGGSYYDRAELWFIRQ
jgi:peptide/nickel transport system substrate-binding protein